MKFKGTIIITDPCYIMNKENDKKPDFYTWPGLEEVTESTPIKDYTKAQLEAYLKYVEADEAYCSDWDKCNYGDNMEALGITHYITRSTIYGDWGCTTYKVDENPKEIIYAIEEAVLDDEDYEMNFLELGQFCADAGLVSVFLLDEVLAYNPSFEEYIKIHPWCITKIPDFDGEVEYIVDCNKNAHIIGTGNINFFTIQTGI